MTPAAMGFAVNASTFGMAVAGLTVALFSKRIGRRCGILLSLAILSIPTAARKRAEPHRVHAAARRAGPVHGVSLHVQEKLSAARDVRDRSALPSIAAVARRAAKCREGPQAVIASSPAGTLSQPPGRRSARPHSEGGPLHCAENKLWRRYPTRWDWVAECLGHPE